MRPTHKEPAWCRPKIQQNRCAMPFEVLRLRRCLSSMRWFNLCHENEQPTIAYNSNIKYHICIMYVSTYEYVILTRLFRTKQFLPIHIHPMKRSVCLTSKCLLIWEFPWRQNGQRPFCCSKSGRTSWNDSIQKSSVIDYCTSCFCLLYASREV